MQLPNRIATVELSVKQLGILLKQAVRLEAFEKNAKMEPSALNQEFVYQLCKVMTEEEMDVLQGTLKEEEEQINQELFKAKVN